MLSTLLVEQPINVGAYEHIGYSVELTATIVSYIFFERNPTKKLEELDKKSEETEFEKKNCQLILNVKHKVMEKPI